MIDNQEKDFIIETIEGDWAIEREDDNIALLCSEVSEKYLIVDKLHDLSPQGNGILLSAAKINELCAALEKGATDFLISTKDDAQVLFELKEIAIDATLKNEEEKEYRKYLNGVKEGLGAEDWEDTAMPREDFVKNLKLMKAQATINNYKNDKLYESTMPYNLRSREQFVIWKYEVRKDGGLTKVPYNPKTGNRASSDNQWTWSDFKTACEAVDKYKAHGLGVMFAKSLMGIDIDHCIVDGKVSDKAREIVDSVNSYTEYSPSGTGVHILCFGSIPECGNRKNDVEIYAKGRFFTLTGNVFENNFRKIPKADATKDALLAVYDKYVRRTEPAENLAPRSVAGREISIDDKKIIEKCLSSKRGKDFDDMYNHGITNLFLHDDGTADLSSHDLALCSLIAYYTGDEKQVDRIFRQSLLMRPKWDEKRGAEYYGDKTIKMAIAARGQRSYDGDYYKDKFFADWWNERKGTAVAADEDVLKICAAKKGKAFDDMFNKGVMSYYINTDGTPSRAKHEYALIHMIAQFTKDPEQVDRIFKQGKLMRADWDENGGGQFSNGQKLIRRVMSNMQKKANEADKQKTDQNIMD